MASTEHLPFLDGWRGVAVALVLAGHFGLDAILPGTSVLGVDLFFVLSGRLMAEILFIRQMPLPKFFLRRFSRVYPALLAFVALATVIWWGSPFGHKIVPALLAATFTINYAMVFTSPVAILDHLWSLCVEEHGYALLAVVALALRDRPRVAAWLMLAGAAVAILDAAISVWILQQDYFTTYWRTDTAVAPILLSAAFRLLFHEHMKAVPAWVSPAALILAVAVKLSLGSSPVAFALEAVLLAVSINALDQSFKALTNAFSWRPLTQLGLWSFSLYLWQQPFYKMAHEQPSYVVVGYLCLGLVAGLASFYLIERPARTYLNDRFSRRGSLAPAPAE